MWSTVFKMAISIDAVNQCIWSLSIELRLEDFVFVAKCKNMLRF